MRKIIPIPLVLAAFVPLMADSHVLSPYISPKNLLFRFIVVATAVLFSLLLTSDKEFAGEMTTRLKQIFKNKALIFTLLTTLLICASALFFAFDKTIAFWGEGARGEGAFSFIFFSTFLVLLLLFFKKGEWRTFFRISLFVAPILFCIELYQALHGMDRPESLLGNPNFLATYYLFVITSALLLIRRNTVGNDRFWNYFSYFIIPLSLAGILLAKSRAVLVGIVLGGFAVLVFFALSKQVEKKVRTISGILLATMVAFSTLFLATRTNPFWQHIPGVSRIASFSLSDSGTHARLINAREAIEAVSPKNESVTRLLFGWGWDNYTFAWQKYYDPLLYTFDRGVFDRTHNAFLDMLVMGGLLAFLAYIASLLFWIRDIVKIRKEYLWVSAVLLFWAVAYLVQNIFSFDTITAHITFYALLAYSIFLISAHTHNGNKE